MTLDEVVFAQVIVDGDTVLLLYGEDELLERADFVEVVLVGDVVLHLYVLLFGHETQSLCFEFVAKVVDLELLHAHLVAQYPQLFFTQGEITLNLLQLRKLIAKDIVEFVGSFGGLCSFSSKLTQLLLQRVDGFLVSRDVYLSQFASLLLNGQQLLRKKPDLSVLLLDFNLHFKQLFFESLDFALVVDSFL